MARTPSSSLTAKLCQTAQVPGNIPATADEKNAATTPKAVLTLAVITVLQTAALIAITLHADATTHIAAAFAMSAMACFGLAPFVTQRHIAQARGNLPNQHAHDETTRIGTTDSPPSPGRQDAAQASMYSNHPPRRNKPPTFATVGAPTPVAAPNAALPENLSPTDRAWADLMARISHDLRTPLNAVIGFSELLQQEAFGPLGSPRYQEYARHIHECGAALLKTAEDTLAMTSALAPDTRSTICETAPVRLRHVALEAAGFLRDKAAARNLTIDIDIASDLDVHGEKMALRQILLNLICEAMSHARSGTRILITATPDDHHYATLEVSSLSCRDGACLDTLPMCVARSLLHFSGAELLVTCSKKAGWHAQTRLEHAKQTDFFRASKTPDAAIQSTTAPTHGTMSALAAS